MTVGTVKTEREMSALNSTLTNSRINQKTGTKDVTKDGGILPRP